MAMNIPAAAADPITPARLGPMACISSQLSGSAFKPSAWDTRADMGTAETPAEPISGFIFSFKKRFMMCTVRMPPKVQTTKVKQPETEDQQRLEAQEYFGLHGGPDRESQKDGDDVHQGVLGGVGQSLDHPALAHEVAEHEHAHQGRHGRDQQNDQDRRRSGERAVFPWPETGRSCRILIRRCSGVVIRRMMGGWIRGTMAMYE